MNHAGHPYKHVYAFLNDKWVVSVTLDSDNAPYICASRISQTGLGHVSAAATPVLEDGEWHLQLTL